MHILTIVYAAATIGAVVLAAHVDIENGIKALDLGMLDAALGGAAASGLLRDRKMPDGPPPADSVPDFDEKLKHFNEVASRLSSAAKQAMAEVLDVAMKSGFPPRKALEIGLIMDRQNGDVKKELQRVRNELFPSPPTPKKLIQAMLRKLLQKIDSH